MPIPENFPEDLVDEILCHVLATSLKGLRTTCQRWNRLFKDSRFARKHLHKAPKQCLSVITMTNYGICPISINLTTQIFSSSIVPSVQFKPELSLIDPDNSPLKFEIDKVFHCDGFLLYSSGVKDKYRIVVWNPLTCETRSIRPRDRLGDCQNFVLGYCNYSKRYKILNFAIGENDSDMYDFSSDSWRVLSYDISLGWSLPLTDQCVSLKGNAYMFVREEEQGKGPIPFSLINFDFSTEKSLLVPLPNQLHGGDIDESPGISVVREEKICVLGQHKPTLKTEIWVSNKIDQGTKVVSWSKILSLDLSTDLGIWYDYPFLLDEEKKLFVCSTSWEEDDKMFFKKIYIVGEDSQVTQVDVEHQVVAGCWPRIYNYVPSLVRIDEAGSSSWFC